MTQESTDCKICMVAHDEEIHAATLNIRHWFLDQVTKNFEDDQEEYFLYDEEGIVVTAA